MRRMWCVGLEARNGAISCLREQQKHNNHQRVGQCREQRDRRAERHHHRREADRCYEYPADRPACIVAKTLSSAANVGRVELGQCDRLKKSLATGEDIRRRLLDALLAEALEPVLGDLEQAA